ncbi:MAG: twin-arginine translocation signal domain-containing protein, partial [Verrucomicrobia bacterium]|nr:twin-arginine translocation signal domain-containing protein [Verrucomicrobiota bacterium]
MCNQKKSALCHRKNGISRRRFLGAAGAAVAGSQLLDDLLCFAAESVPSDKPSAAKPLLVDRVSV